MSEGLHSETKSLRGQIDSQLMRDIRHSVIAFFKHKHTIYKRIRLNVLLSNFPYMWKDCFEFLLNRNNDLEHGLRNEKKLTEERVITEFTK